MTPSYIRKKRPKRFFLFLFGQFIFFSNFAPDFEKKPTTISRKIIIYILTLLAFVSCTGINDPDPGTGNTTPTNDSTQLNDTTPTIPTDTIPADTIPTDTIPADTTDSTIQNDNPLWGVWKIDEFDSIYGKPVNQTITFLEDIMIYIALPSGADLLGGEEIHYNYVVNEQQLIISGYTLLPTPQDFEYATDYQFEDENHLYIARFAKYGVVEFRELHLIRKE